LPSGSLKGAYRTPSEILDLADVRFPWWRYRFLACVAGDDPEGVEIGVEIGVELAGAGERGPRSVYYVYYVRGGCGRRDRRRCRRRCGASVGRLWGPRI
jgi:hypothetical protein